MAEYQIMQEHLLLFSMKLVSHRDKIKNGTNLKWNQISPLLCISKKVPVPVLIPSLQSHNRLSALLKCLPLLADI